jgi:hypothetical protein
MRGTAAAPATLHDTVSLTALAERVVHSERLQAGFDRLTAR